MTRSKVEKILEKNLKFKKKKIIQVKLQKEFVVVKERFKNSLLIISFSRAQLNSC